MTELYSKYCDAMFNVAWRFVKNDFEAEEIVQESFLAAFQKLSNFRSDTTFGAWIKRIVINKSLDFIKKKKLDTTPIDEEKIDVEEELNTSESLYSIEQVKQAIYTLPDGYRVILSLYLIEGYDHEEISEILNITNNTSRSQFMRAKKKLRTALQALPYEG